MAGMDERSSIFLVAGVAQHWNSIDLLEVENENGKYEYFHDFRFIINSTLKRIRHIHCWAVGVQQGKGVDSFYYIIPSDCECRTRNEHVASMMENNDNQKQMFPSSLLSKGRRVNEECVVHPLCNRQMNIPPCLANFFSPFGWLGYANDTRSIETRRERESSAQSQWQMTGYAWKSFVYNINLR